MSAKIEEGSSAKDNITAETKTTEATAAGSSKDTKRSEGNGASRGTGGAGKSKKAKSRKGAKAKVLPPPPKTAGEKNTDVGKVSVATQVDVRAWVTDKDLLKEKSKEIFWRKVAENNQATVTELKDDNIKLHATIDYLSRENVRYQQIIEQPYQYLGTYDIPALPTVYDEEEEENTNAAANAASAPSL